MPLNSLPPILPTARPNVPSGGLGLGRPTSGLGSAPGSMPRAQNFSISKLQQQKDIEGSRVSISQLLRERREAAHAGPATSIAGSAPSGATTSINRPMNETREAQMNTAGADDRRYGYVRGLIKERQAREAVEGDDKKALAVKTGTGFRKSLLHKSFGKMIRAERATYNSIGPKDRAFFEEMVGRHAAHKTAGTGFHRHDRISMREEVQKAHDSGQMSYGNMQRFKKLIDQLE